MHEKYFENCLYCVPKEKATHRFMGKSGNFAYCCEQHAPFVIMCGFKTEPIPEPPDGLKPLFEDTDQQ
jgi:hypothetical protein